MSGRARHRMVWAALGLALLTSWGGTIARGQPQESVGSRATATVRLRERLRAAVGASRTGSPDVPKAPRAPRDGVTVERNLVYAETPTRPLRLDVYRPEGPVAGVRRPLVVWIHGGGWRQGSHSGTPAAMLADPQGGYVVASIEYRLTGEATFPAQIEDCRAAIRWLRAHADRFGIDPDRVGVWGSSAGGHLAALVGTADDVKAWDVGSHLDQPSRVQAVCNFYGPADFTAASDSAIHAQSWGLVGQLLGGAVSEKRELARAASPVTHVDRDDPPFLVVHGTGDVIVPVDQSDRLVARLNEAGVPVSYLRIEGVGHGLKGTPRQGQPTTGEVYEQVRAFFDAHLKPADLP